MEASQHSLLAACFTLHSINATLAIVPQRGAGLWINRQLDLISELMTTIVKIGEDGENTMINNSIIYSVRVGFGVQIKSFKPEIDLNNT
jgi:hypothetical protein